MSYYITAEGGGTKLIAVLYDENCHIINTARTTGTNTTCRREEDIAASMETLADELLPPSLGVTEIERLDMSLLCSGQLLHDVLARHCSVKEWHTWGEGHAALAANESLCGIVAQSGTGSDAFLIQPGLHKVVGGWGPQLGDEGSGYEIGLSALKAVIYADDGRGPHTLLEESVRAHYKLNNLWELVGILLHDPDMRRVVSSAARLVSEAAHKGDAVALDIYRRAADAMAEQVLAVIRQNGGTWAGPIVASGGAWKGHPSMFTHFAERVRAVYPQAEIVFPRFEPVVGPVFLRMAEAGIPQDEADTLLRAGFARFLDPNRTAQDNNAL